MNYKKKKILTTTFKDKSKISRIDNYHYLKNDKKTSEKIVNIENKKFKKNFINKNKKLSKKINKEFLSRLKQTTYSIPSIYKKYYWFEKIKKNEKYNSIYIKKKNDKKTDILVLDNNKIAKDKKYWRVAAISISPDEENILITADTSGKMKFNLYLKNVLSKENPKKELNKFITPNVMWHQDGKHIYYIAYDKSDRPAYLWLHQISNDDKEDKLIYTENDEKYSLSLTKSDDEKFIFLNINSYNNCETHIIYDYNKLKLINKRKKNHNYHVDNYENYFYILTNLENKNYSNIMRVKNNLKDLNSKNWSIFKKYDKKTIIVNFKFLENYLIVHIKKNGNENFILINMKTNESKLIFKIKANAYDIDLPDKFNLNYKTKFLIFRFSTPVTPPTYYKYYIEKDYIKIKKQNSFKNYNPNDYTIERKYLKKNKIPLTIIYKKDVFSKNGKNKCLLYGYGAYGQNIDFNFSRYLPSLLDRGFIYCISHVRGSSFYGRKWWKKGKMLNKKNSFKDFYNSAKYLIENKYTSSDNLCITGGSAGGLLVGATLNINPSLFKSAVLEVPFLDVLSTMLDSKLRLTEGEKEEWGDPNIKKYYKYISEYSPYDNIKSDVKYPNILIKTGINDSLVSYIEPLKYFLKLKETNDNINLFVDNFGHQGPSDRYSYMEKKAITYSYIIKNT